MALANNDPPCWQRSFIALVPDAATRAGLAALPAMPNATPLHVDDLHLTLAFLGEISDAQRRVLVAALPELAAPIPPLAGSGLEAWPTPARARVWVTTFALPEALRKLVARVQHVVTAAGLPVESRPFRPHITLARFAKGGLRLDDPPAAFTQTAHVEAVALYCRASTPDGPRYMTLASAALRRLAATHPSPVSRKPA